MMTKDAEELIVRIVEEVEIFIARLLLDDDGDVVKKIYETRWQLVKCLLDELLEFAVRNHQPGMILNPNTQPLPGRWNGLAQ